jgi:hypothetical protein
VGHNLWDNTDVEGQLPKLDTRVRFPSPAPFLIFNRLRKNTPEVRI